MALIVEDGSTVANANSYVTRADFLTYAAAWGITIENDENTDALLRQAFTFIDRQESRLIGTRASRDGAAYPRKDLIVDGFAWNGDEIPRHVLQLQYELAIDLHNGIDIYNRPPIQNSHIKRERVEGIMEVEYAASDSKPLPPRASPTYLLASLSKRSGLFLAARMA